MHPTRTDANRHASSRIPATGRVDIPACPACPEWSRGERSRGAATCRQVRALARTSTRGRTEAFRSEATPSGDPAVLLREAPEAFPTIQLSNSSPPIQAAPGTLPGTPSPSIPATALSTDSAVSAVSADVFFERSLSSPKKLNAKSAKTAPGLPSILSLGRPTRLTGYGSRFSHTT